MPAESTLLLGVLFVIAVAAGFYLGRRTRRTEPRLKAPAPEYYAGLNYLLNDQPDKALEKFLELLEVDDSTLETHFALASLFRRRGEVDRAIRIHQNIIARPNLDVAQRNHALGALGEDYLRAGLFDRAEKLFLELAALPGQRAAAMQSLLHIYEQQSDWTQAIKVRRKLNSLRPGRPDNVVSHYYCELADAAMRRRDTASVRHYLKRAGTSQPSTVRAELMQAKLAEEGGDPPKAAKRLRAIAARHPRFAAEALMRIQRLDRDGETRFFADAIRNLLDSDRRHAGDVAYAAIVTGAPLDETSLAVIAGFVRDNAALVEMLARLGIDAHSGLDRDVEKIAAAMARLAEETPRYRCRDCGYEADRLYWQCPGCRSWESCVPNAAFRFNVRLDFAT